MTQSATDRLPSRSPTVAPPPPFAERRVAQRRADDRDAHREKVLLARALDILASGDDAETRLAGLLRLLARTAGARRVAFLADGTERRAAVAVDPGEDPAAATELATWLDAHAERSRAQRAASGPAPISLIVGAATPTEPAAAGDPSPDPEVAVAADERPRRTFALLPMPNAGRVVLGFEFDRPSQAGRLSERLPRQLARHAAVALALMTEQLATAREVATLRARDAERATFVSTVAHELRTPLTGLRGYLELILAGKVSDPDVERDFLERSSGIVDSMAGLVGDLLELSRLESGTLQLEIEPFSAAEAGEVVAERLLAIALERGTSLRTTLPPRLRAATGDRRRVEQILTNLAANALKFTPAGGSIEIEARFDGPVAVFAVRDDGPGIEPDDRARIFERFHRLSGHERVTGTGLGLPIARDLARRMAGELDVASSVGRGSAFVLVLPGPAPVEGRVIEAALRRALDEEERSIEERSVLRHLAAIGRDHDAPEDGSRRPRLRGASSGSTRLRGLTTVRSGEPAA